MFNTMIIENFFDNFELLHPELKKIPLYSQADYPEKKADEEWPGKRSEALFLTNKFLFQLIIKELRAKSQNELLSRNQFNMHAHLHLRLNEDNQKDFIHTDVCDLTMIVYLSETNLKSGTAIYNDKNEETQSAKFVQNTAFLFAGKQLHGSILNYGDNIDNGRLTLNCFIKF